MIIAALTSKTVKRSPRAGDPSWAPHWFGVEQLGLDHVVPVDRAPPIGVVGVPGEGDHVEGRFFPKARFRVEDAVDPRGAARARFYQGPVVLVRAHQDPLIVLAATTHELGHYESYREECKRVPQTNRATARCRYKGEHDDEFYRRLEPMYVAAGVPTYAARAVEGSYAYPPHWREEHWP